MGEKVQIYIYDLSRGMARSLGPAIIGKHAQHSTGTVRSFTVHCYQNSKGFSQLCTYLVCLVENTQPWRRVAIWLRNLCHDPFYLQGL
jgi:hypothetical protein